jgi:hypothetical protein
MYSVRIRIKSILRGAELIKKAADSLRLAAELASITPLELSSPALILKASYRHLEAKGLSRD